MAYVLGIKVDKICIYPSGGISKFNMAMNEVLIKEFLVLIMGPIAQIITCYLLIHISYFNRYIDMITMYNNSILIFNLLPIYPLDGGRLLNIIMSLKLSFKKSLTYTIYFSFLLIILLDYLLLPKYLGINLILINILLFSKVIDSYKKIPFYSEKFLLERYLNNYKFRKEKVVNNVNNFMRGKKHLVKIDNKYYTEKEILHKKFDRL